MNKALVARAGHWWKKEIRPLLILALIVFTVRSSLADWNDVPSGSMKPTILEGDRLYVNKLAYDLKIPFTTFHLAEWINPQRGDIVVFFSPHDGQRLVKRAVGLPGDAIELRNNFLLINGKAVEYASLREELSRDVPGRMPSASISRKKNFLADRMQLPPGRKSLPNAISALFLSQRALIS